MKFGSIRWKQLYLCKGEEKMKDNSFWKTIAIISTSLLIIVLFTSAYYGSSASLGDVCEELSNIKSELDDISYYLSKIWLEI